MLMYARTMDAIANALDWLDSNALGAMSDASLIGLVILLPVLAIGCLVLVLRRGR